MEQPNHQFLARVDFNLSDNTKMFLRYNLQRETQPFVIGLWWRNGDRQVPYPSSISAANQSDSATLSLTHVFDPTLTSETIFGATYIDFPNAIDDRAKISRQALGYPYQGVFGDSNDQIPSFDLGGWGANGPLLFNPGGFDPVLFATKWQFNVGQNITKVAGTHTAKLGPLLRADHQQPARQRRQQRVHQPEPGHGRVQRQHVRRPAHGAHELLPGDDEEPAAQHRLEPLGGLRPGLLEGPAERDPELRRPLLAAGALDRPGGERPGRVGPGALQPLRALQRLPGRGLERAATPACR